MNYSKFDPPLSIGGFVSHEISIPLFVSMGAWLTLASCISTGFAQDNNQAVVRANRPFAVPEMQRPTIDEKLFTSVDVGAKIPNYTAGQRWGTQGDAFTSMQNPLPANLSMQAYSIPNDFRLALWACESSENWPDRNQAFHSAAGLKGKPIAMNWDERGRLWVCETVDYPNELQSPGQGRDRIKICVDTDNDGQADKFTVFAENLSIPSTLVCYRGGVIVQDGTTTVYLKDTDGDDIADFRQVLITGWAMGDTHGGVSNFQYGPDNWIWGMQGYNNSQPVIHGEAQMRFRQGFWRFKVKQSPSDNTAPAYAIDKQTKKWNASATDAFNQHTLRVDALEFIRATNNNTWGLGFSEEGYVFGSTANGCPSVHMPIPNRYYDQVVGWSAKTLEKISPTNNFRAIDSNIRQVDYHGGYTAAAGHALYTARNYPEAWWNRIAMVCEPTAHIVGAFVLEKSGAGYKSNNSFNAVASIDDWSAPIMSEVGPDGNVWVLDWYNYIVQHNPTPNGFRTGKGAAYESDLRDKRFGRIYRLLYAREGQVKPASYSLQLSNATNGELVAALSDRNFFWRRTAQRLLVERGASDNATLNGLVALVEKQQTDEIGLAPGAMHAIWTLAGLRETARPEVDKALETACSKGLSHISSPVRVAAIENCLPHQFKQALEFNLHADPDARVRLAMMLRIARNDAPQVAPVAVLSQMISINQANLEDEVLLDAWTSAASTQAVPTLIAVLASSRGTQVDRALMNRIAILAEHVARSNPTSQHIEQLLQIEPNSPLAVALWEGLAKGWPRNTSIALSESAQKLVRDKFLSDDCTIESRAALLSVADKWQIKNLEQIVDSIQTKLFSTSIDQKIDIEKRHSAWEQAIRIAPSSNKINEAVATLLSPQLTPEFGRRAIDSLKAARVTGLSKTLLDARSKIGPTLAADVITMLLGRVETTADLLSAIEAGQLQWNDLALDQRAAISNHPDRDVANRANELMKKAGSVVRSNRQSLVEEWMSVTQNTGDLANGLAVYKKHCAQCHKHGEIGTAIGPNLTGMAVHPKAEILVNVLDPSRSVENNFRTYQILTMDGQTLTGMLAGESSNALRLINSQGKEEQVLREDISTMKSSNKSLMPEGFESSITRQEMTDLLTFLANRSRYTPLSLSGAATMSTEKALPGFRGAPGIKYSLPAYGKIEVDGVPFEIQDPQGGNVANMIALQGQRRGPPGPGRGAPSGPSLPSSVSVPCVGKMSAIHLLGGVAVGGIPNNANASPCLIVRSVYQDGKTTDTPLIVGKHIANYQGKTEVPESKFALEADGKQIRYLKIEVDASRELKSIDLIKGDDFAWPLVFALTVESAGH